MEIEIGKTGLGLAMQDDFEERIECPYCGGTAWIAFVAAEVLEETYICKMHPNDWEKETDDPGRWIHDSCAVAVYICRKCLKPVAEMDQA